SSNSRSVVASIDNRIAVRATMKNQTARVVLMQSVAARLVFAFRHWDQQSNLDSAQKDAPSTCDLRSSKSIRTGPAGAVLRRLPERTLRPRRLSNAKPDKLTNNQPPRRRTNKAHPTVAKKACKNRQPH